MKEFYISLALMGGIPLAVAVGYSVGSLISDWLDK